MSKEPRRTPYRKEFTDQRHCAMKRGISWELSFSQWLAIWQDSGHFHERGKGRGKYVMARYDDEGPYAFYNVKIITGLDNFHEGNRGNASKGHSRRVRCRSIS
jgi:hypothetical protein